MPDERDQLLQVGTSDYLGAATALARFRDEVARRAAGCLVRAWPDRRPMPFFEPSKIQTHSGTWAWLGAWTDLGQAWACAGLQLLDRELPRAYAGLRPTAPAANRSDLLKVLVPPALAQLTPNDDGYIALYMNTEPLELETNLDTLLGALRGALADARW